MKVKKQKKLETVQHAKGKSVFTEAEWETARKKFKERENGAADST